MPLSIEQRRIPVTSLRPGAIVVIDYTKTDGSGNSYLLMVVDTNRPNPHTGKPQLHGYLINEMTESEFINFIVSLNAPMSVDPTNAEIKIVDLSNTEAYAAMRTISTYTVRPYRTFNMSGVKSALETVINIPDELDTVLQETVLITDRTSKRKVLQALYDGDINELKTVREIQNVLRSRGEEERDEYLKEEAAERELVQSRPKISLRQLFNSFVRIIKGK